MGKTRWEYSLRNEAMKVVHDAHYLVSGFYKINNFVVLPYGDPDASASTDWFPDLDYSRIPRFWTRVKRVNVCQLPIVAEPKLIDEVEQLLKGSKILEPNMGKLKKAWGELEDEFLDAVNDLVFGKSGNISEVIIYPTHFGNLASFGAPESFPSDLKMFIREDADVYAIADAILASVTRRKMEAEFGATWNESEIFVDWNLLHGPIGRILAKSQPDGPKALTMQTIRATQRARTIEKSHKFYKKLGVPSLENLFNERKIELSGQNKVLFDVLFEHQNEVVSIDGLGDLLFKGEDDFSLYAISKAVERLRNKFEENGISGSYIQACRGQGYMLRN